MYWPNSVWTWTFMLVTLAQAVIALALEAYVFAKFQIALHPGASTYTQSRTIPTYLSVFMFGYIYQLVLVYDALRLKNTIQVMGLTLYNIGILVYSAIQKDQIHDAVMFLTAKNLIDPGIWTDLSPILIVQPCLMALGTVILAFVTWKLYDEFAWTIYKHISADLRLRRRYLTYQVYIALLKFDFFFFLGFTVQFLVVVEETARAEYYLTIAALPIIIILLLLAGYWTRKESFWGMVLVVIIFFAALAYFLFKLVRMYAAGKSRIDDYKPARTSLTTFAVITIILLIVTIIAACVCTHNFNKGLKPHINSRRRVPDPNENPYKAEVPLAGPVPSRMTID